MRRALTVTAVLAAMVAASSIPAHGRSWQQIRNAGTIRIGIALATPWVMRDRDREFIGFDIDVAKQLAADMEVEPEFVVYGWDRLIPAIESEEIDIIVSGLSISPERALHVNFSAPYAHGGVTLATNLSSTASVESLMDLDDRRFTLGVVVDSVASALAERLLPRITVRSFESAEEAGQALVAGEIDAYMEEEPVPTFLALDNPSKVDVPLASTLLETHTAFAISKGNHDFLAFLNAWIIAHEADTWLPTTYNYWFKSLRWRDRLSVIPEF